MTVIAPGDIPGLIPDEVGDTLASLAKQVEPGHAIVEIGSYAGKSATYLALAAPAGVPVYAVDPWEMLDIRFWCRWCDPTDQPTLEQFLANLDAAGVREKVTPLQGLSTDVARRYDGPPIGFLYIDGDHERQAVLDDMNAWKPHCAPHAVIVFDDYAGTANPGVSQAVGTLRSLRVFSAPVIVNERLAVARLR